ncbi:MAG: ATP-binding protein [Myxococcota bacterium]
MNKSVERALLARPLALCLGGLAAVWLSSALRSGPLVGWIVALTAGPGLILWLARDMRFVSPIAHMASPVLGLLGWGALATFTQGLKSPFLAAFFIEVALAGVSMTPLGVFGVTGASISVLLLVQSLFGLASGWQLWLFEAGALAVMGGLGWGVARRRETGERLLREQGDELGERLDALQRELEDERVVSRVGENVARLAHGLKNAVHSLRGFVGLIEPQLEGGASSNAALAGLRTTIDELEKLARLTLSETGPAAALDAGAEKKASAAPVAGISFESAEATERRSSDTKQKIGERSAGPGASARVVEVLEEARSEMTRASPSVEWQVQIEPGAEDLVIPISATPFLELLVILMRNAVEAMDGRGVGRAKVLREEGRCVVLIADEGEGISAEVADQIFVPGYTTKKKGSGFGLFLARRIVQDQGGSLELGPGAEKGAVVRVEIPVIPEAEGRQA